MTISALMWTELLITDFVSTQAVKDDFTKDVGDILYNYDLDRRITKTHDNKYFVWKLSGINEDTRRRMQQKLEIVFIKHKLTGTNRVTTHWHGAETVIRPCHAMDDIVQ